ncbi:MAG: DUF6868 family protein, partial [Planctomycetota bacterium]
MDITALKEIFMWCTIINAGLLILMFFVVLLLRDFSYRMNHIMFSISRQEFNVIMVSFFGLFKLFF